MNEENLNEVKSTYTPYDFDRPDKFSVDQLRSIESIFSVFSRNLATDISGYLRLPAEIDVKKIEQVPFQKDYLDKKERDEKVFCIVDLSGEQILFQLDVGFLLQVHSKQTGGKFGAIEEEMKKNITEFEKMTTQHLIEKYFFPNLKEAFKGVQLIEPKVTEIETDPQYAKITLPQDMIALVTLSARIQHQYTNLQVVLPFMSIEKIVEKLNSDNVNRSKKTKTSEQQINFLYEHVNQLTKPFIVNLGEKKIKLSDLSQLEEGHILLMNEVENELLCSVDGKQTFKGKIGVSKGKHAVKITGVLSDEMKKMGQLDKERKMLVLKGDTHNEEK